MKSPKLILIALFAIVFAVLNYAQKEDKKLLNSGTLASLKFRSIGPALTSGRIIDIAVSPFNKNVWYIASASGGVWKTTNAGTTFDPIFDNEGSYSIGCVVVDPVNPSVVWVGTGENNSQRSVSYGDGIYRSEDGGKTWKNMGLKTSEHLSKILIDPNNPNIVYVAAQGPLWNAGGERGLYKTTDAGKSWNQVLKISDNTGVTDAVFDPRNSNIIYAASYQRRRHVFTLINGGPESAIHKSTDGGLTWNKLTSGLPSVDIGRIGLAIPVSSPDIVYAVIEAADGKGGMFRSVDRGATWEKRSSYVSTSAQYYNEIFCDPKNPDMIYALDTYSKWSKDGGKIFTNIPGKWKHVDDHALWIDPADPSHFMIGSDGGLYETFDNAENWNFKANLPVTQFYRVAVDNAKPFYNVYGGTQDNFSIGGPSQNMSASGIVNSDWFITNGGDGFVSKVDPKDPNTVYAESQYGGLIRYDKKTGEIVGIKPVEDKDEEAYRWNWDSPLIISPHNNSRLYFSANKVFRSDDKGNSWKVISGDLSMQIDRNKLPVMSKIWGPDAVAKSASTSLFGNIVAFAESPKKEGLLIAGTDDGVISISTNGGTNWQKQTSFPGVPDTTYVSALYASRYNSEVIYSAFDNHKKGDYTPYLLKSEDGGKSWKSIAGNLPAKESVYSFAEDFVNSDILFAGTEYGIYVTVDGGKNWNKLKGGLPTIAVRDIAIQEDKCDLVIATFGRGFYVLDDYSVLRSLSESALEVEAKILDVKDCDVFLRNYPLGLRGKGFMGASYFSAENPPFGTTFTIYLKDGLKTKKEMRQKREKEASAKGENFTYPTIDELKAEDLETAPYLVLTITDESSNVIRRMKVNASGGISRINWNLRYPTLSPVNLNQHQEEDVFSGEDAGALILSGVYNVQLSKIENGIEKILDSTKKVKVGVLNENSISEADRIIAGNHKKAAELRRAVLGTNRYLNEMQTKIQMLRLASMNLGGGNFAYVSKLDSLDKSINTLQTKLTGDNSRRKRNEADKPSLLDRVGSLVDDIWNSGGNLTGTQLKNYDIASEEFEIMLAKIKQSLIPELEVIEKNAEKDKAPYTPGRLPEWVK